MKIIIINQEPLDVTQDQATQIVKSIASGAEVVIVNGEMVKSSAIMGVRHGESGKTLPVSLWGQLPAGEMKNFFDERREPAGPGYEKFKEMRSKLFAK